MCVFTLGNHPFPDEMSLCGDADLASMASLVYLSLYLISYLLYYLKSGTEFNLITILNTLRFNYTTFR